MNTYYVLSADGTRLGPYSEEDLRTAYFGNGNKFGEETLYWTQGMSEWAPLKQLFGPLPPPPPVPAAPPSPPPLPQGYEKPLHQGGASASDRESAMKALVFIALVIVDIVLLVWYFGLNHPQSHETRVLVYAVLGNAAAFRWIFK